MVIFFYASFILFPLKKKKEREREGLKVKLEESSFFKIITTFKIRQVFRFKLVAKGKIHTIRDGNLIALKHQMFHV